MSGVAEHAGELLARCGVENDKVDGLVIRRASQGDRNGVVAMVAAAFAQDPGWAFIFGEEYEALVAHFVGAVFDIRVASHNVWVTDDLTAVAMWDSPGKSDAETAHAKDVWTHYRASAGEDACERLALYNGAVSAVSPAEPHWYLGVLATHPQRQREGLATAVLTHTLHEADQLGLACCLETSTADNRRF